MPAGFAADGVVVGGTDMGPLAGNGARALALDDPEQFLRKARLATAGGAPRNAALAHILDVETRHRDGGGRTSTPASSSATVFPRAPFGNAVRTAAQLAANGAGVAVVRLSLGGFDTHQNQPGSRRGC